MECIFCDIANKKQEANIVYEDTKCLAFHDIHPKASVHILVIPKKHIESVNDAKQEDAPLLGELLLAIKEIAAQQGVQQGYKLAVNVGRKGGQIVDHLHIHLLGEKDV
jgi:histidine triad (HIT) family protein